MTSPRYTADQVEACIADAIKERDFPAVRSLIAYLAVDHPDRAQDVLDTIDLAMVIARQRSDQT